MGFISKMVKATAGVAVGTAFITALPVLGAAGAISATGTVVGSAGGALAGWLDD